MIKETNADVLTNCPVRRVEAAGTEGTVGIRRERERRE